MSISAKTGRALSGQSRDRIKKSAWLLFQCQDESGDVPNYGNNDGALVFPVTSCGYRDFRPVINTTYALAAGNQLYGAGKHQEELIWFAGGRSTEEYGIQNADRASSRFADAGLFTIRARNAWAMIVLNEYRSRPAHMDQLHFDLWIDGENVLCDAGTYSYASREGRTLIRNESHNTAVVDGSAQMNAGGPFLIYGWSKRELGKCDDTGFSGKMISANGYKHSREIKRVGAAYEILDQVDRNYSVRFHTPCDVEMEDGTAVLSKNGKQLCRIRSSGEISLAKAHRSLYYLKKEETNCLSITGQVDTLVKTTIQIKGDC